MFRHAEYSVKPVAAATASDRRAGTARGRKIGSHRRAGRRANFADDRRRDLRPSAGSAQEDALQMIAGTVRKQAMTMSYNDAFLLFGLSVVLVSPVVFLLRTRRPADAGAHGAERH